MADVIPAPPPTAVTVVAAAAVTQVNVVPAAWARRASMIFQLTRNAAFAAILRLRR